MRRPSTATQSLSGDAASTGCWLSLSLGLELEHWELAGGFCGWFSASQSEIDFSRSENVGKAGRENAGVEKILNDRRLQRVAEKLKGLVRNAIRVQAQPLDTDPPIGASRLGGRPDLPPDMAWPTGRADFSPPTEEFRRDHPQQYHYYAPADGVVSLPFVAQINLSEATEFDRDNMLPKEGLLLFFYDARGFPSDTDLSRRGCDEILADGRTYKYEDRKSVV